MKPPELKTWQSILLGMILGAVILAAALLVSLPDRMTPIIQLPTSTVSLLQVYVVGAVKSPGVVQVPVDSRIQDVLNAADGVNDNADLGQLNLAAVVGDGQKIYVPVPGEIPNQTGTEYASNTKDDSFHISLNSASQKELEKLPGIGEEKAKAIIAEREKRGRFQSIDDLMDIPGITQKIFIQIRPYLYLD
jgi:competence protein ComEA